MTEKYDERFLKLAKSGDYNCRATVSTRKILEFENMSLYARDCTQRIAEMADVYQELVESDDIIFDLFNFDISLTLDAFIKCRSVFDSYIDSHLNDEIIEEMKFRDEQAIAENNILFLIRRKNNIFELLKLQKDIADCESHLTDSTIKAIRLEILGRLTFRRARIFLWSNTKKIRFYIKHFRFLHITKKILRRNVERIRTETKGLKPAFLELDRQKVINDNFKKYSSKKKSSSKANLIKHVYYGIKVYSAPKRKSAKVKSFIEIDADYRAMKGVLDSIKKLTPNELMSLFPPDKKYDGNKCGEKDYFSTMEAIRRLNGNEPIGEECLKLLENYINKDTFRFLLHWFQLTCDMRDYLGDPKPYNEFNKMTLGADM